MQTARRLVLPPPGFPNWMPQGDPPGGLLYLAWGKRRFGQFPIERTRHDGWIYAVIVSGNPILQLAKETRRMRPGHLALIGPDSLSGWIDGAKSVANMLVWVWRRGPEVEPSLPENGVWNATTTRDSLKLLNQLHSLTRLEIQKPDGFSDRFLLSIKDQLDVTFARATGNPSAKLANDLKMHLATAWMIRHLNLRDPVRGLADYLGVSPTTLQRSFRSHTGRTPKQMFMEIKFAEAHKRLSDNAVSIKKVALDLGYKQPGDFSRAYRRHFGVPPSTKRSDLEP